MGAARCLIPTLFLVAHLHWPSSGHRQGPASEGRACPGIQGTLQAGLHDGAPGLCAEREGEVPG